MSESLDVTRLPDLPQVERFRAIAPRLWAGAGVEALWIGGSLARGAGDAFSDLDVRLAVRLDALELWREPDFEALFAGECVGRVLLSFAPDSFLHHLLLRSGDLYDLLIAPTERVEWKEPILLLGCRNAPLCQRFAAPPPEIVSAASPAAPERLRQALVDYWILTFKQSKILHRRLDPMTFIGLHLERQALLRLWYVLATGQEPNPNQTIHSVTEQIEAIQRELRLDLMRWLGAPAQSPAEIIQCIETLREEVARTGRRLAARFGFAYPEELEATVRSHWDTFLKDHPVERCSSE